MSFFDQVGTMAIGSRLRRMSGVFTDEARRLFDLYGVGIDPKWFPVFYVLARWPEGLSTSAIAKEIGHSHASVSQIVKAMCAAGLVSTSRTTEDARVNLIRLSDRGRELTPRLTEQCADVGEAIDELLGEAHSDLWRALADVEHLLEERPLYQRVKDRYRRRELQYTEIIEYRPEDRKAFKDLNIAWIERYFEVEETDLQQLDNPFEEIIEPGGYILMALYRGEVVGTCALIKADAGRYELAKMAVTDRVQGKGIGLRLGQAVIEKAREVGAATVFLESNTVLEPAIALYRKLGFKRVCGPPSPYERCNIQMELALV